MKVSLIGTSKTSIISQFTPVSPKQLAVLCEGIGKLLAEIGAEIIILPDTSGVQMMIADAYRKHKGKKVVGLLPLEDKKFGTWHLADYPLDEKINMGTWYNLNGEIACMGDVCVCVGMSCGTAAEIGYMKYNYKFHNSKTKLIVFRNTMSQPLHKEMEADLPHLTYVSSVSELRSILEKDL